MSHSRGVQWTGAIASALAGALIALGSIVPAWWTGGKGALEMGVGLRGVELCGSLGCASRGLDGLGGASAAWPRLGAIGFPLGIVAACFLLAAAAAVVLAMQSSWTARLGRAAAGLSIASLAIGAAFAWLYPGFDGVGVGWALAAYLFGAAIGVGAAGLLIVGAASRPAS